MLLTALFFQMVMLMAQIGLNNINLYLNLLIWNYYWLRDGIIILYNLLLKFQILIQNTDNPAVIWTPLGPRQGWTPRTLCRSPHWALRCAVSTIIRSVLVLPTCHIPTPYCLEILAPTPGRIWAPRACIPRPPSLATCPSRTCILAPTRDYPFPLLNHSWCHSPHQIWRQRSHPVIQHHNHPHHRQKRCPPHQYRKTLEMPIWVLACSILPLILD